MVEAPGTVGNTGSIPIFEKELERVHAAIEAYDREGPSHIAIIADPFAGQGMLFSHIREQYADRVVHLPLFSVVRSRDFTSGFYGSQDIVLMERCHFLALRRIGGFAMLDVFLDALSTSEKNGGRVSSLCRQASAPAMSLRSKLHGRGLDGSLMFRCVGENARGLKACSGCSTVRY